MISEQDIRLYFKLLPKNFEIEINNNIYKCNKFCLKSFSSVISKLIDTFEANEKKECTNLSIQNGLSDISKDKIDIVINFIHGLESFDEQKLFTFDDIFDYYYISSVLGIDIIRNRLCSQLTKLVSSDNVSYIFQKLSSYPDFCEPIIRYFDNHDIQTFKQFIDQNIFDNQLINSNNISFFHTFLKNSMNLFQKENVKLNFIKSLNEQTKNSPSTLVFYHYIRLEELNKSTLNELCSIPIEASPYLNCFKLITNLMNEKQKLTEALKRAKFRLNRSIADLEEAKAKKDNRESLASESASRITYAVQTESSIRQKTKDISEKIELLSADIALISVQNECTIKFLDNADKMHGISEELAKLMQSFYDNGGWVFWPGSSVNTLNNSKSLNEFMNTLINEVKLFRPNQKVLCDLSQEFLKISDDLKQVENI